MCLFARERYTSMSMTKAKAKLSLCHCKFVLLAKCWYKSYPMQEMFSISLYHLNTASCSKCLWRKVSGLCSKPPLCYILINFPYHTLVCMREKETIGMGMPQKGGNCLGLRAALILTNYVQVSMCTMPLPGQ